MLDITIGQLDPFPEDHEVLLFDISFWWHYIFWEKIHINVAHSVYSETKWVYTEQPECS